MLNFNFDELATDKAAKKVAQLFQRAGAPVIQTEADSRVKRTAGVTYREMHFTHADGQRTSIRITKSGDVGQVLINGSVIPLKNQSDPTKAIGEIAKRLEDGRAKFQAKLARTKVELPKGIKTAAPKMEQKLTEEIQRLDTLITERTAQLEELKAKLGPVMDSANDGVTLCAAISEALELAGVLSTAALDGVDYGAAKAILSNALHVVETNHPINMREGNIEQAEAENDAAKSIRAALVALDGVKAKQPEHELPFKLSGTLKNYAKKRKLELFDVVRENKAGDPEWRIEIWSLDDDDEWGMIYSAEKDGLHLTYLRQEWKQAGISDVPAWIKDEAAFKRLLDYLGSELVALDSVRKSKEDPLTVVVKDEKGIVMRMAPADFMNAMKRQGMPSRTFLEEAVKVYNEHQKKIGSTMYAEVQLTGGKKILDGARKINQKDYAFYVVAKGKIESGWEYREDATEQVKENLPSNLGAKVYAKSALNKLSLNPDDNSHWWTGAEAMDSADDEDVDDDYFDEDSSESLFDEAYVDGPTASDSNRNVRIKTSGGQVVESEEANIFDVEQMPETATTLDGVADSLSTNPLSEQLEEISGQEWDGIPATQVINAVASAGYTPFEDSGMIWTGNVDSESGRETFDLKKDNALTPEQLTFQWEKLPSGKYQVAAFLS